MFSPSTFLHLEYSMSDAIKKHVTVQRGGRIEVFVPELPEGTEADVIVLEVEKASVGRPLASLIGKGKGAFGSPQEVDRFIRAERDRWL
jgi:hypothetical protein